MSNKLLPCPCCNGKAKTSDGGFGPVNQDEVFSLCFVECVDCGLMVAADTLDEALPLWIRRFVCLDKNGDKVFAGDEVNYTIADSNLLRSSVMMTPKDGAWVENSQGDRRALCFCDNIELISEDT